GRPGPKGEPDVMRRPPRQIYLFTRHSQSSLTPTCPEGTATMWEGYSLLHVTSSANAQGQDLGSPGSCLRRFSYMPYVFCNLNNVCNYAQRNSYSYWLSTAEPLPAMMQPIEGTDVQNYISRCTVCESRTKPVAIHSQETYIPDCPNGWYSLWTGYSFLMNTDAGGEGVGQSLSSPGSCLENFRSHPYIECQAHGRCDGFPTGLSFWLAIVDQMNWSRPRSGKFKAVEITSKIGRCNVCSRIPLFYTV
ncbi:unnamed protein product, partial [Meganyctiphanes norvegica]